MYRLLLALLVVGMAGCSATYNEPKLSDDNPASLSATDTPLTARSQTLDISNAEPVMSASEAKPMGDAGHNMDGMKTRGSPAPSASSAQPAVARYACPMHPDVTSEKPDQRCPKCGMKLKKVE